MQDPQRGGGWAAACCRQPRKHTGLASQGSQQQQRGTHPRGEGGGVLAPPAKGGVGGALAQRCARAFGNAARRQRRPQRPRRRRLLRRVLESLLEAQAPWTRPSWSLHRRGLVMATQQRPFHLVVFGASGFTGQFVTEEVAREQMSPERSSRLPWAVAGRSREKLQRVLERAAMKLGRPTLSSEVGIIICDITNPASLDEMAKQATVVLNCVGPYRFYGEPVVKACVENGTSCIDICGEPQFLELMYWKYHEKAAEKGAYIIGSSGFDSIPADLGVIYTRNKMNGTLTAVESFLTIHSGPEGLCTHDGTWKSAVYGFGDQSNLKKLRNESNLKPVPIVGPKLKRRWPISYCRELNSYSIPFLGADVSVVKRTQRYLHENLQQSPVQYAAYVAVGGVTSVIKLMFAGLFFLFFVKFGIGRQLLIKFPWLFSFGYFSKQGPTQKQIDASSFTLTFFGQGYSQGFGPDKNKPNIRICTQVKGPEAGYVATPIAMVQAAITLLTDTSDLPKAGGVFTPGAAFSRTKLIDRLNQRGIEFSVISSSEV
ncbi:LOW QUALITY PROTEIN: saccharopine dehydrogenase-like oxidoreductase [Pseudorca crassidens]|uniref:LOW QUALITY PROTEIN: saccharopine dehydrogenase-like oxidoreductase n=1 Tax=Pseudorca crassidens TaxID=82174 RepID=UPI00352EBAFB